MARSPSNSRSRSPVKRRRSDPSQEPETENGCPFLIRLFVTKGRHTPMVEFEEGRFPLQDEFTAYGWKTSTPSSLIQLLLPSFPPPYRSPLARYSFRHIYVDASPRGLYRTKDLVSFTGRDLMETVLGSSEPIVKKEDGRGRNGMDMELDDGPSRNTQDGARKIDEKTLDAYGFVTGDLISVSLHIPEPRGFLRRPTMGAGSSGPGGNMGERGDSGRNGPSGSGGAVGSGAGAGGGPPASGQWQHNNAGRPPMSGDAAAPGNRWGRGGGNVGAGPGVVGGNGARGSGRRSRSPDYGAGSRPEKRETDKRSASPERKRESWKDRKRDP